MAMPIVKIDTHQHFWLYTPAEYGWMGPHMGRLKKDHLPADLWPLLQSSGIDGTIAVQARQCVEESRWLLELADENAFIKGVVGWVDLCSPKLREQLELFASHPKYCGIRHVVQDEPDDRFVMRADFLRGVGQLSEFGLTYDLLLFPRHLPVACELVRQFPEQPFAVDHLAKPRIKENQLQPWENDIRRLARFENVFCKVSGMVTEADWDNWNSADFKPYLDVVLESFGTKRLMLGSDWPVCTLAGTYPEVMRIASDYIGQLSKDEQAEIWSKNAKRFYGIGE